MNYVIEIEKIGWVVRHWRERWCWQVEGKVWKRKVVEGESSYFERLTRNIALGYSFTKLGARLAARRAIRAHRQRGEA